MDFRNEFHKDVVVDLWCYRLHGHNEGDDPAFTQPVLYSAIRRRKTVRESYLDNLQKLGSISAQDGRNVALQRRSVLEAALKEVDADGFQQDEEAYSGVWSGYRGGSMKDAPSGV